MEWRDRALQIMREKGIDQIELAERMNTSQGTISRLLKHGKGNSIEKLERLATALEVTYEQLTYGISRNSERAATIPLLPAKDITIWLDTPDLITPDSHHWIPCPVEMTGMRTFAYQMEADEMGERFDPGVIVMYDPDIPMETTAPVLVLLNDRHPTFRKAMPVAGEWYLHAQNKTYEPRKMTDRDRYCGTAICYLGILR